MDERLEAVVSSLLYEGYALYPYTPGATKNATPTPFGIVYPPVYAAECDGAFDHARLECVADAEADARLTATLCYLAPSGERHQADERRVESAPSPRASGAASGSTAGDSRCARSGSPTAACSCAPASTTRPESSPAWTAPRR